MMGIFLKKKKLYMLERAMKSCLSLYIVKFVFLFSHLNLITYSILQGKILINKFTDSLEIRRATEEDGHKQIRNIQSIASVDDLTFD